MLNFFLNILDENKYAFGAFWNAHIQKDVSKICSIVCLTHRVFPSFISSFFQTENYLLAIIYLYSIFPFIQLFLLMWFILVDVCIILWETSRLLLSPKAISFTLFTSSGRSKQQLICLRHSVLLGHSTDNVI